MAFRAERDPLGELPVPTDAYYGEQTARAVENFPISGLRAPADLVVATILVKKAEAGLIDATRVDDILSVESMTRGGIVGAGEAGRAGRTRKAGKE